MRRCPWPRTERDSLYPRKILEALKALFGREASPSLKRWMHIILNRATETARSYDPSEDLAISKEEVESHQKRVLSLFPWTHEHEAALCSGRNLKGGVRVHLKVKRL